MIGIVLVAAKAAGIEGLFAKISLTRLVLTVIDR
jgi:hypothetical protein